MMIHRPGISTLPILDRQTAKSPSVLPVSDAMPIGMNLSDASRAPIQKRNQP
jgi:hypothetical protein